MKSFLQIGLTLVAVVVIVFFVTFGNQYSRNPIEPVAPPAKGETTLTGLPLRVPERKAVWDPADEDYAAEFEVGTKGHHYDFWVSNAHPKPAQVTAEYKSCVCADVQLGLVPPAARVEMAATVAPLETAFGLLGVPSLAAPLAAPKLLGSIKFDVMQAASPSALPTVLTIPAADPAAGPQLAVVRLDFFGKEAKPLRVVANLRAFIEGLPPETTEFEVSTVIVPPVIVAPSLLNFGPLGPNDVRERAIIVWSPTRDSFPISANEAFDDPCIEVRAPRPMTAEERATLPFVMRAEGLSGNTRIKSGYVVKVVVHERRDGQQLELGPLNRKVGIRCLPDQPEIPVMLGGTVRGGVRVGEGSDLDRINLATFRANHGVEKVVLVTSTEPGVDLELKGKTPDFLNVTFERNANAPGLAQWRLRVEIEPNKHSGFMPAESAVYLQTKTTPPRSIRVPVVGNATR